MADLVAGRAASSDEFSFKMQYRYPTEVGQIKHFLMSQLQNKPLSLINLRLYVLLRFCDVSFYETNKI